MATSETLNRTIPRQAVIEGVRAWQIRQDAGDEFGLPQSEYPAAETILASMPRRVLSVPPDERKQWFPYVDPVPYRQSLFKSLARLLTWLRLILTINLGTFFDQLLRRDSQERRAIRFRRALEKAGGTFVKLGQQLAMRVDLLPWAYCVELSKMLDRMAPFPVEQALASVERAIGRPWQEVFDVFDPNPIGSASLACVYQAILKDGTKVVVKVRRPGIESLFISDLKVLDWVAKLAEFLTIIRPGFTEKLRVELRDVLMEELNFRREARFQDIFRRNARKAGWKSFTAAAVYFEYSDEEVLVQEFVSGLWLWEVINIVEHRDPQGLALLRELNIDPTLVGRRILLATFWSGDDHIFFHADPHPANILVRPNSELTFVDFGSCGSFNNQQRVALEQLVVSMKKQDVEAMARASLSLMEPLQPVDLPMLVKHIQEEYLQVLYTFNTPAQYTEYWERTSARLWFVLIRTSQKFNLQMNLHMLRMIRSTLLYDSIVLRLDNQLDRYDEYSHYIKIRARFIKSKWRERLRRNAGDDVFLKVEQLGDTYTDLMMRAQSLISKPIVKFSSSINKWIFATSVLSRMAGQILLALVFGMSLIGLFGLLIGEPVTFLEASTLVVRSRFFQLFFIVAFLFSLRLIVFRLRDRDPSSDRRT